MKEVEEIELEEEILSALQRICAKHRIPAANVAVQLPRPPAAFPPAAAAALASSAKDEREASAILLSPTYHHPQPPLPVPHRPTSSNYSGRPGSSSGGLGSGSAPVAPAEGAGAAVADSATGDALTHTSSFSSANFTPSGGTAVTTPDAFHHHYSGVASSLTRGPSPPSSAMSPMSGGGATHTPPSNSAREVEDSFLQEGSSELEPVVRVEVQFVRHARDLAHTPFLGWAPPRSAVTPIADTALEDGTAGTVMPPGILSARPSSQQQVNSPMSAVSITDDCFSSPSRTSRLSRSNHSGNNINALRWSINSGSGLTQGTTANNNNNNTAAGSSIMLGKSSTMSGSAVTINGSSLSAVSAAGGGGSGAPASTSRPTAVRLPPEEKLPTVRSRKTAPTGVGRRTPTFSIIHNKDDGRHPSRGSVSVKEEEKPRSPVHHPMLGAEAEQGRQEGILLPAPHRFFSGRSSVGSDPEDTATSGSGAAPRGSLPGNSNSLNSNSNSNSNTAPAPPQGPSAAMPTTAAKGSLLQPAVAGSTPTPPLSPPPPPSVQAPATSVAEATGRRLNRSPTSPTPSSTSSTGRAQSAAARPGSNDGGGSGHHHRTRVSPRVKMLASRPGHGGEDEKRRERKKFMSTQF